jgi:hypothetical protein
LLPADFFYQKGKTVRSAGMADRAEYSIFNIATDIPVSAKRNQLLTHDSTHFKG